ncbi:MAG: M48 family metalloprotease [Acidobacteria bacterium]|nr:M48 family metalloprotease [Acidobacteriota bacterium]
MACVGLVLLASPALAGSEKHRKTIDQIGNRDMGGKVLGIFPTMSINSEMQLGARAAAEFEQTAKLFDDPVVADYVNRVGQKIIKNSDAKVPFHIKIVDTDEVNAFALPGGYFYVNKGLVMAADNEAELAGVMAHEISHVTARHAARMMTKAQLTQLGLFAAMILMPPVSQATAIGLQNGLGLGMNLGFLGITRDSEREADQLGLQYLWNSGYDPDAYITFFEKLKAQEKNAPSRLAGWFRTHPSTNDRMTQAQNEMTYLPSKDEYVINTSEFDKVKNRILAIDNPVKLAGADGNSKDRKRPTLKRRTNSGEDREGDEDRPSLKKDKPTLKRPGDKDGGGAESDQGRPTLKKPSDRDDRGKDTDAKDVGTKDKVGEGK